MLAPRFVLIVSFCVLAASLSSCNSTANDKFIRRTASAANDRIMLVRDEPATLGFTRLSVLSELYPDLGLFIRAKGYPGFLAETSKGGSRYLVLYYLGVREAYACRSGMGKSREVEFSGPYPITESEAKTLGNLSNKAKASS